MCISYLRVLRAENSWEEKNAGGGQTVVKGDRRFHPDFLVLFERMVKTPNGYYRVSSTDRAPLRIGLLLDSCNEISAVFAKIIEDIKASNFAQIELLVVRKTAAREAAPGKPVNSRAPRLLRRISDPKLRKHLLYDLYLRLDARMKPADDPLTKVACGDMLSGIERIEVEPVGKKFVHRFPADALQKVRSKDLDVLIRFGFNILHGDILKAARYGVWSYHHGDNEFYRGGPAHFWELREGSPLSGVVLQVLTEELDGGLVLCKSLFATERTVSVSRNRYAPYWGSSDLIIRKLNELHRFGWDYVLEKAIPSAPYQGKRAIYRTPANRDILPWLGPILLKKAISCPFRKETVQHWRIASRVTGRPLYDSDSDSDSDFSGFRWIDPPKGHFWADPFAFEHGGKCWAFFEDYSYKEKRAAIVCSEVSPQGALGPPMLCLDHPSHHYSYPHIFRAGSEIFMIPESCDSNSVDLFRCREFPNHWVREATLLQGKFVDTTIWEHEGLWWFTTTNAQPSARAGCLLLFYSASLTGDWHFHPANPISTDIRRNRGAGRVFRIHNRMIRPSQSCAPSYGYSVALNEITELSRQRYSERHVKTIAPEHWEGLSGVHTYNWAGHLELIDGRTPAPLNRVLLPGR